MVEARHRPSLHLLFVKHDMTRNVPPVRPREPLRPVQAKLDSEALILIICNPTKSDVEELSLSGRYGQVHRLHSV